MKHIGDIRRIDGAEIEPVDCITFGSPCQDLSIAGKRAGLDGERSGLFLEAVRIIGEMRETTNGIYPAFAVWENVPGAFSSNKGEDFRTVLKKLAELKKPGISIPRPEKGKWKPAGYILEDGWSIAWRTMDAQYWGVPQHRRRIALVVDFGGERAGEILFEPQGVPGDFETGGKTRKTPAGHTAAGPGTYGGSAGFSAGARSRAGGIGYQAEHSPALKSFGTPCVVYDARGNGAGYLCPTITGDHQNRVTDYTALCIQGNIVDRVDTAKCNGKGWKEGISFALNTVDRHAVMCMTSSQGNTGCLKEKTGTLTCMKDIPIISVDVRNFKGNGDISGTIQAKEKGGQSLNYINPVCIYPVVRRLTPLECERLQGYPDNWTEIGPWRDSSGGYRKESSDTARYRALGNSIALPQWKWLFTQMARYLPSHAKLGSLFDGIGGFPLCWEDIHGKGTARWASEIEEFPIAITKYHFEEE